MSIADPQRLPDPSFWSGKRVYLTGHTGFKGAWLALWLQSLGCRITGYALAPPTRPSLFELAQVSSGMVHELGDIRDPIQLDESLQRARPEIVLHLAAQSLVRKSYREPVTTYSTNVMGTVHLLDAVRRCESVRAVVIVTSDKCYENREWLWGYREGDAMGGHDPYSNSKGCAELVTSAMRRSYFQIPGAAAVASARAGNVIGGGDWAEDRLVPDAMRAFASGHPLIVRAPHAIRPWQHVFEPLRGYLLLAEALWQRADGIADGWNFGPEDVDCRPVCDVVNLACIHWPGVQVVYDPPSQAPHEAHFLKLDCTKARELLPWRPRWRLDTAVEQTVKWYRAQASGTVMRDFSLAQLARYATGEAP
ncbi:MAG: CDP-glucose 4,6-dehydratase [Nitrospirota bacterium]